MPLIISAPGLISGAKRVPNLVELVDVMPTVLALLNVRRLPIAMQGRDLTPLIWGGDWSLDRPRVRRGDILWPERKAIRDRRYKFVLIPSLDPDSYRQLPGVLYWEWSGLDQRNLSDLASDPLEQHNIFELERQEARRLETDLVRQLEVNKRLSSQFLPMSSRPDPELLEQLRSLGYIQ